MKNVNKRLNKKTLPPFGFSWYRIPEYLAQTNEEVQVLQISNTVVGKLTATSNGLDIGEPLIIGKKYYVELSSGDDFSNVGYVSDNVPFIATNSTPNVWDNNSLVDLIEESITIFYNDVDINIQPLYNAISKKGSIKITNGLFDASKTYPVIAGSVPSIVDNNTIEANNTPVDAYFKIEIYV